MWDGESWRGNTVDVSKNRSRGGRLRHAGRLRKEGPPKAVWCNLKLRMCRFVHVYQHVLETWTLQASSSGMRRLSIASPFVYRTLPVALIFLPTQYPSHRLGVRASSLVLSYG